MEGLLDTKAIREHPELFFKNFLGSQLWEKEVEIVKSIRDHKRTTIRSCNSSGKTYTMARAVLWFMVAYGPCVVVQTAPTFNQVRNQFWRELRHAWDILKKSGLELGKIKQTELELADNWYAIGVSTKDGEGGMERLQGYHADNILFIVDEASGVDKFAFQAIEGGLTGGGMVRFAMIGNPTRNTGEFADSFKSPLYNKIHISAFDTPNLREGHTVIKGLATTEWVDEMRIKYGEDSDVYRVRVLGDFPKHEADTLISVSSIEEAIENEERERYGEDEVIGLDVARKGDDRTAFVYRKGNYAKVLEKIDKSDLMHVAGRAVQWLKEYPEARMHIDAIGVGAGVYDRLKEQPAVAERVFEVNVSKPAIDKEVYSNLRSEGWHNTKAWLKDAILEKDEDWYQLAAPKYKILSNGKLALESKEEMKRRGVSSPDIGDALVLTNTAPNKGLALAPIWI